MRTLILKLGGSLITRKETNEARVRADVLQRLSGEIRQVVWEADIKLVVVHGAGPFGHVPAKEYALNEGFSCPRQARGIAETRAAMERLNATVVGALRAAGVNAVAFQPSAAGLLRGGRITSFNVEAVARLLALNLVPVCYGDVLADLEKGCAILSGDQLVPYLAVRLGAQRVVVATDYNGIFDGDPRDPAARTIGRITGENVDSLEDRRTSGTDVTGGVRGKIEEMLRLASQGISSEILSGLEEGYVRRALQGEEGLGTIVSA